MRCCFFGKSSRKRTVPVSTLHFPDPNQSTEVSIQCGRCRAPQSVPERAIVMVCAACRCVNRLKVNGIERRVSYIDCDIGDSVIIKNNPTVFQLGETSDGKAIPICSVCLDGVGDIILEHCGHGGICEDCARHIALNKAVGGSHCPLDKQQIDHISRIGELHPEFVKARTIELPESPRSHPPRVPAPVGLRKSKGPNDS